MYSTIAGFVEPGETLEQALIREVKEETGVSVNQIHYHSSQPWPFPSSIMLGFTARPITEEIKRQDDELEDARWFTRWEVARAVRKLGGLRLPPKFSVARRLIDDWLARNA
jgi:NAD+ diphosphatase